MLVDTHAHINFKDYKDDGDEVVKRALKNNIWLINVGAEFETSERAVEYAEKYPQGVFAAVGLHPIHLKAQKILARRSLGAGGKEGVVEFKEEKFDYEKYKTLAQNPKVVAIGEIGLDYYRLRGSTSKILSGIREEVEPRQIEIKNLQKELFKKQIELAMEIKKPVIIHCREAHRDLLEILNELQNLLPERSAEGAESKAKIIPSAGSGYKLRGVIHSFSGNYKQARQYRELGFKVAFNGIITFSRDYDKVILDTSLEDILLETDCPYLAPLPYRSQRNEPLYIIEVAKRIAEIKNLTIEEVAKQTTLNAKEVFNL